tara:strand:+ start:80 stop:568 length:489 start_codon:yes stop_codon:yes gene_type:complete
VGAFRLVSPVFIVMFALLLTACPGDATPPRDLLLSPDDFPRAGVTETSRETGETNQFEPAVQVELTSLDFTVLESLVLFDSVDLALALLSEIKQDQISQGVDAHPVDGFEANSGVLADRLHGEDASTLFFVEGRALVRITLSGVDHADRVWDVARLAREKSG